MIFFLNRSISIVFNPSSGKQERLVYTNFKNTDPQAYDYVRCVRYFFMMLEYLMVTSGTFDGLVLTMNSKGMSWRHITKTPMNTMKQLLGFVQVRRTKNCLLVIIGVNRLFGRVSTYQKFKIVPFPLKSNKKSQ